MPGGRGPGGGGRGDTPPEPVQKLGPKAPGTTSLTDFELSLKNWEVVAVPLFIPSRTVLKVKGSRHSCVLLTERNVPGK